MAAKNSLATAEFVTIHEELLSPASLAASASSCRDRSMSSTLNMKIKTNSDKCTHTHTQTNSRAPVQSSQLLLVSARKITVQANGSFAGERLTPQALSRALGLL